MNRTYLESDILIHFISSPFLGERTERSKSERQKSKKNVQSLKVDQKFEKDQNVKNEEFDQNIKNQNVEKNVESQK